MNVLVLGSGGREHALCNALLKNSKNLYLFPGNDGIFQQNKEIKRSSIEKMNEEEIANFCQNNNIDLVVIGPENLLASGMSDYLESKEITVYGPSKAAATLESSKIFSKKLMKEYNIPTAAFTIAENYTDAENILNSDQYPEEQGIVLKADGLAGGKGVVVTFSKVEALKAAFDFMENDKISVKTEKLLIEKFLTGKELSVFAVCNGEEFTLLGSACDYKRLADNDEGPNTGGMGCYTPLEWPGNVVMKKIEDQIIAPTLKAMKDRGTPFRGTLFCGLMINDQDVNVVEYNVRFGDPETQTILPLIEGDFANLLYRAAKGESLPSSGIQKRPFYAVHIVKSSKGYPSLDGTPMLTGQIVEGGFESSEKEHLFYAGVSLFDNNLVNTGGRVLGVTTLDNTLTMARESAYHALERINFNGNHYRTDIAKLNVNE